MIYSSQLIGLKDMVEGFWEAGLCAMGREKNAKGNVLRAGIFKAEEQVYHFSDAWIFCTQKLREMNRSKKTRKFLHKI